MSAEELKALGNKAFISGDHPTAIDYFTKAIELDPTNHVLYSNRSASYSSLKNYEKALEDATKAVELKPDWAKGYSRKGAAHHGLGDYDNAIKAYEEGLRIDPGNKTLEAGLRQVEEAASATGIKGLQNLFKGNVVEKIRLNPKISHFLNDPQYVAKINDISNNPTNLNKYMDDQRIMNTMFSLMGMDAMMGDNNPFMPPSAAGQVPKENPPASQPKEEPKPAPEPTPEPEPEPKELTEEDLKKQEALKEKELGSNAYKAKNFEQAIIHFDNAWELDNTNVTILTNKAAALFEMGSYDECIKVCEDAVEVGREYRADFKLIAKAFGRIGNAYLKKDDLDNAIKYYNKSLTEHRTADILGKLKSTEKEKELRQKAAYFNPQLADEAREKGNEYFKKSNFAEAVKHYTEAIKRNEKDPRCYSNRAACYTKLMAFNEAIKDCDTCIALDPKFIKAYIRKATIEFLKKDYNKCIEICEEAKKHDTEGKHAAEIDQQIYKANYELNSIPAGPATEEERKEALKKAANDPEVQRIMNDPVMQTILQQMQSNPAAIQEHMKNPTIASNIRKLISTGIIRMG